MANQGSVSATDNTRNFLDIVRKNMEALAQAQSAMLEGNRMVFQRQAEMFEALVDQAVTASREIASETDPAKNLAKRFETAKTSIQNLIGHSNLVSETNARANGKVVEILEKRMMAALDECKVASEHLVVAAPPVPELFRFPPVERTASARK